ncbi:amidohydrolase [Jatrophihabitans cynanchi]|uniref:Amidohydrolase n=1 Tax=Jatrophihabitans cynanchi TaxID=2944128 RepID=A0ABY7K0I7_9ACTN|nr:amidohydrolase family protein [Jatrophihabitans sp. SB3-54]WAX58360.1 amidohydrolase [Jatrophihabitans sp. SB3-54]
MGEGLAIVSVDDHIIEPAGVWQDRLPKRYLEVGPRVIVRDVGPEDIELAAMLRSRNFTVDTKRPVELWAYEDTLVPTSASGLGAVAGREQDEYDFAPRSFAEMPAAYYEPLARVREMDRDGVLGSLAFPSYPRFAGQIFLEAKDKDLALLCVQAYNDWMIDEWCGSAPGRLIPLCIVPLWDPQLAVAEIERTAAKGARGITFTENPWKLGLPSIHDGAGHWDPVFAAMAAADLPLCIHIGSSSATVITADDMPPSVRAGFVPFNGLISCFDWLLSGVFVRHPRLKLAISEGGIGWVPFVLERADWTWEHQPDTRERLPELPSHYYHQNVYGCVIHDPHGMEIIEKIGIDKIMMETDYPHSDSTWPNSIRYADKALAGLDAQTAYQISRGNAERLFRFKPSALGSL